MAALGFSEDALRYYRDACERSWRDLTGQGMWDMAQEFRQFLATYRASGQKIAALDKAVEEQVASLVRDAKAAPSGRWIGVQWHWDDHVGWARRGLEALGFDKIEIDQRLGAKKLAG